MEALLSLHYYCPMQKKITTLILSLMFVGNAHATCFDRAAQTYGVEARLLKAIAKVESSGKSDAINMNKHKNSVSYDIGLMQINSTWLRHKFFKEMGYQKEHLLMPCTNVMVGAWVLANNFRDYGTNWEAVGAYNASCKTLSPAACQRVRLKYINKVYKAYKAISS